MNTAQDFICTVQDLEKMLVPVERQKNPFVLLDVREDSEREIAVIPGDVHIPMGDIPRRYQELDDDRPIVVYCHSGIRSAQVCQFLHSVGIEDCVNLRGGIDAWSKEIDETVARY